MYSILIRIISYIRFLYSQLIALVDVLLLRFPPKGGELYDCVVVRTDGIGDFVIWGDVAIELRKHYNRILYICPTTYSSFVTETGLFDNVLSFDRGLIGKRLFYNVRLLLKLSKIEAKVVINPMKSHHDYSDFMVGMLLSNKKLGVLIKRKGFINRQKDRVYTEMFPVYGKSVFKINEEFVQSTFAPDYNARVADFRNFLSIPPISPSNKYCFVSLSSSEHCKIWPVTKLLKCLEVLPNDIEIVLSGYGNEDVKRAEYIEKNYSGSSKIYNTVNKTDIVQMARDIAGAFLVMGNDSAAIHFAASFRVHSICYSSGVTFNEFIPYPKELPDKEFHPFIVYSLKDCFGCHGKCYKHLSGDDVYPCLEEVSETKVINAIQTFLES